MKRPPKTGIAALMLIAGLLAASAAHAGVESPEPVVALYQNGGIGPSKTAPVRTESWGQLNWQSQALGSEAWECSSSTYGQVWNEGTQKHAEGIIDAWYASGHVSQLMTGEAFSGCQPRGESGGADSFVSAEAPVKTEQGSSGANETADRTLSTPWNMEAHCGVREDAFEPVLKIGVPSSEFPLALSSTVCPAEATEEAEAQEIAAYAKEREEGKGCYVSKPAPAGCTRYTFVQPATGLEVAFGGTLHGRWLNGVRNGLSPSKVRFEGPASGELQCEWPAGCTATASARGEMKQLGYNEEQLLQLK